MARIWEDGFDHYGLDETNMLDGSYAQHQGGSLSTAQFSTGTHSYYVSNSIGSLLSFDGLRRVVATPVNKIGCAARVYFPQLPVSNYESAIFTLMPPDTLEIPQLAFTVGINGEIHIIRGGDTIGTSNLLNTGTLVAFTDPVLTAAAWHHVEVQAYIHDTAGWVRVAVNGVHRYELTGIDTRSNATYDTVASVAQNLPYDCDTASFFYIDDLYYYDFTGNSAIDTDFTPTTDGSGKATGYIGELQVWPLFPNGDTVEADWGKSAGTVGYSLIDELTPDDTDYIYSTLAADLSEFALQDLPAEITYIRGLGLHARMSKSDAGTAQVQLGMKSVAATSDAAARPLTVEPTYWRDMINVDPNSAARWTRDSLNAAWLRLTRSA